MLVGKGSLTFRTYQVAGKKPAPSMERVLERLEAFAFSGLAGGEEGQAAGWVAPEHLFDGGFDHEKVFRGPYAVFALRIDARKVSGPLLAAHTAMEVQSVLEAEGLERLSRIRKSEIKQEIRRRLLEETPPTQKAYGVFWNLKQRRVHVQNTSKAVDETFRDLFERAFELEVQPQGPGLFAAEFARENDLMEPLQDARPFQIGRAEEAEAELSAVS